MEGKQLSLFGEPAPKPAPTPRPQPRHPEAPQPANHDRAPACRGCGAKLRWAQTVTGTLMCFDPDPVDHFVNPLARGVYKLEGNRCLRGAINDHPGTEYHMTHWATCPVADSMREQKRAQDQRQVREAIEAIEERRIEPIDVAPNGSGWYDIEGQAVHVRMTGGRRR